MRARRSWPTRSSTWRSRTAPPDAATRPRSCWLRCARGARSRPSCEPSSMRRADLARALAGALVVALASCSQPVRRGELRGRIAQQPRPNLVLIVVDTLRADRTTPYGFAQDTTPELARWAARGVVFEQVLAQSSWTKISMASLLTSLWPQGRGGHEARDGPGPAAETLAERLGEAGYRRYGVQTNGWLDESFGFHQGFEHYVFPAGRGGNWGKPSVWP